MFAVGTTEMHVTLFVLIGHTNKSFVNAKGDVSTNYKDERQQNIVEHNSSV